ncbi:MAG TPA: SurA N-terminal domain-containing protein [Candidatus Sulfotelmatobacter sp.]
MIIVAVVALLLAWTTGSALAGEVIDRIVATVNGRVILQSDWDEALSYEALLDGRMLSQFSDDDRRAVLDRLIDQELLAEQTKSADFQHATREEALAHLAAARKQYPSASTDAGWESLLAQYHLTQNDLLDHVEKQIDLTHLVDARLRPGIQIDSKTIEAYYREKFVPQLQQTGAGQVPLADVSAKIRELLTEQKVSELLVSWLQTLRSESDVHIPGSSVSSSGEQER